MITAAEKQYGNIAKGIGNLSKVLRLKGNVYPVSLDDCTLCAQLKDGTILYGEKEIDDPKGERAPIDYVFLEPRAGIHDKTREVIINSDLIVIGPGDLYTSVIPNLLVGGVPEAIRESKAKTVYVCNLMTKCGETDGYKASDFIRELERYLKMSVDYVICNQNGVSPELIRTYEEKKQFPVDMNLTDDSRLIVSELFYQKGLEENLIRHDRNKLAEEVIKLVNNL